MKKSDVLLLLFMTGSAFAFSPHQRRQTNIGTRLPSTELRVAFDIAPEAIEDARSSFYIWFFGASGAAGIARSAFPKMYQRAQYTNGLKGKGPTKGGERLGLSPFVGYPEDIYVDDVKQVVNNKLTVEQIVDKFPQEDNFLAKQGYLTFAAFNEANANANPLAVRAIFDAFKASTDCVEPEPAQDKINAYKQDLELLKRELLFSKVIGYSAVFTLLFMLGLADIVAAGHAYNGWFPEWPGGENFPLCILDKETGPWTIPQYWLKEY